MEVELMSGWGWECPACKKQNFCFGDFEADEETQRQAEEDFGGPGQLVAWPDEVTCAGCLTSYKPKEPT